MKTGLSSSMTTIERKFGVSGTMISIVLIMDNITGTIASLFVGYYATKVRKKLIIQKLPSICVLQLPILLLILHD